MYRAGPTKCIQLLCTLVVINPSVICQLYETIETRLGSIRGEITTKEKEIVYQFRKIPYAKPPVGNLRFKKPQPYGSWNGTLDATDYPPSCMQVKNILFLALVNKNISEDCLYLNIYVPRSLNMTKTRSVMIWIHGGSFISGQASSHDGSDLALKGDVIVVTINYRLGIFGFVSSGDHLLPGNYGLWDQRMAIVWVRDNIGDFSGDSKSVTLFGSSAGSWSVNIHAINTINQGLFHRVILQSGTILSPASLVKSPNLLTLTRLVDCGTTSDAFNNHSNVVNCLQKKSPQELLHASTAMAKSSGVLFTNVVGAVIDGEIILDYPMKILQNVTSPSYAFFRSLDVIIGATNGEGSVLSINQEFIKSTKDGISTSVFCGLLCKELAREFFKNNSLVSEAVCYAYRVKNGNTTEKAEQARQTANMVGDIMFITPAIELLNIHSRNNSHARSYQYSFENELVTITPMPLWYKGSNHGAEVVFLFNLELWALLTFTMITDKDKRLKDDLCRYWTNFAKTGNPNSSNRTILPLWREYSLNKSYIELNHNIQLRSRLFDKRIAFWQVTVPALVNPVIKTNSGMVKGETIQYPTGTVLHFRGIPYAKPPVNNLRFEKSEAVDKWNGILDATQYKSACIQRDSGRVDSSVVSEDCLFLNIVVPGRPVVSTKKAVMIWIHDNNYFTSGKGDAYDGSLLALKGDVIVVNFNYRLGLFGFLNSNDTKFKGNYGLWDQRLALTWVKSNIGHFGGNTSVITVFGDGTSVTLQTISPLNRGLFQRAIAQGGNALSPFAFSTAQTDFSDFYTSLFGCKLERNKDIVHCLKNKPARDFLKKSYPFKIHFMPVMDGELIPAKPSSLLSDLSNVNTVDMIIGINNGEGSSFLTLLRSMYNATITYGISRGFVCGKWVQTIIFKLGIVDEAISSRVCQIYEMGKHNNSTAGTYAQQALRMMTDAFLSSSLIEFLKLFSKHNSKTFQYLFSRVNSDQTHNQLPPWFEGSKYGTEIGYVFHIPSLSDNSADNELSDKIMAYWSNFAKNGDPNSEGLPKWSNFGHSHEQHYLEFCNDTVIRQRKMYLKEKMRFWFDIKGLKYGDGDGKGPPFSNSFSLKPTLTVILTTFILCLLVSWI